MYRIEPQNKHFGRRRQVVYDVPVMIHDLDVEEILDGFVVEVVDSELLLLAEALENTREEGEGGDGVGGLEVFARFLLLGFGQLAGVDL